MSCLLHFIAFDSTHFDALIAGDDYASLSGDLLREVLAFREKKIDELNIDKSYGKLPLMLQWGPSCNEFDDGTNWEQLQTNSLRRACFERCLATTGTAAELVTRLPPAATTAESQSDSGEPEAKRHRSS